MSQPFADHFSSVAASYALFRPSYPARLFDWLAALTPRRTLAWDCAAGSGQATPDLAARFERVIATDASRAQIEAAPPHPQVEYRVATAEDSGLASESADLIVAAQALHWFDIERFYTEACRVLAPAGVIAVWSYSFMQFENQAIHDLAQKFYADTVGPFWPPERKLVEEGYATLSFPFQESSVPDFGMEACWSLAQLLGYLRSWSATLRFFAVRGYDPVIDLERELTPLWGSGKQIIRWPLAVRAGRKV